jgi:hypothetical protein
MPVKIKISIVAKINVRSLIRISCPSTRCLSWSFFPENKVIAYGA